MESEEREKDNLFLQGTWVDSLKKIVFSNQNGFAVTVNNDENKKIKYDKVIKKTLIFISFQK